MTVAAIPPLGVGLGTAAVLRPDVLGLLADVLGLLADVLGLLADVLGLLALGVTFLATAFLAGGVGLAAAGCVKEKGGTCLAFCGLLRRLQKSIQGCVIHF
jgi:hypothetical protein